MKLALVVQARTSSTRLPGKVLLPVAGAPVLARMVERLRAVRTPHELVVATTTDAADDPIRELCREVDVRCYSGHPTDLLDRHYRAASEVGADAVAKIPSDCPLIDPAAVDRVLGEFMRADGTVDFVSNLHPPTWPDGNDVEVMSREVLEVAVREAQRDYEREHTTPFIWDAPERFRLANVRWETGLDYSKSHRLTLDYPEDYELIAAIYSSLYSAHAPFSLSQILALLDRDPELAALNAAHRDYCWQRGHVHELNTVEQRGNALHWR